jgi:hypothetical protein
LAQIEEVITDYQAQLRNVEGEIETAERKIREQDIVKFHALSQLRETETEFTQVAENITKRLFQFAEDLSAPEANAEGVKPSENVIPETR